ncbi:MAG: Hsp33 family molecular chaperone HslO [Gammaproteobacteria bacterium]|nr:Hsp33 family molecular chaperone HslO [Gammaproteobacteria bacterium]
MKSPDHMHRFLFEEHLIRGQHVSLDASWQQIVSQSDASGVALDLLGHALAAAALMVETLKIDGSISLQIRGSGAIHLLVAEATSSHTIRGIVRQSRELEDQKSLRDIFESDKLVITIKNGTAKPHQGIVPLSGDNLAEALQAYFDQSEQLPTQFVLACNVKGASGMMLQKLPEDSGDADAWNRLTLLAATTEPEELLKLPVEQILGRLFHQESLRVFDPDPVEFACSCSVERTRDMLLSLGKSEIDAIIEEQEEVSITCEFCNSRYQFDKVDLGALFNDSDASQISPTRH